MDQNSGNTTDKRNWRERLGIGKAAAPDAMPKLSDDFKAAPAAVGPAAARPTAPSPAAAKPPTPVPAAAKPAAPLPAGRPGMARPAPHTPVKAAPMAPRAAARPAATGTPAPSEAAKPAPKPQPPRVAPVAPDALATKLRDQREAAERLAVQRVQAAKQRAEAQVQSGAPGNRPKFSFAEDNKSDQSTGVAVPPAPLPGGPAAQAPRPAAAPIGAARTSQAPFVPQQPQASQPQVQPPRPALGGNSNYSNPPGYQQGAQGYTPQSFQPQYQPSYGGQAFGQQPPAYRPIDPATGYVPPPGFNPAGRPGFPPASTGSGPRLSTPPSRSPLAGDRQRTAVGRGSSYSTPQMPMGAAGMGADLDGDDVFEAPQPRSPRRATANEYQQAYRDELGYEDELPRSRGLGMILGLLLLAIMIFVGAVYGYTHFIKPGKMAASGGNVPVVSAPAGTAKVNPDANAANADQVGKKQIYDRIEGDHEVPGAPMKSNEEAPVPPAGSGSAQPAQQDGAAQPATGGSDGTPLPLPPPPGGGTGQQGALSPDGKTDMANIDPAAEPVSAANSSAGDGTSTDASSTPAVSPVAAAPAAAAAAATGMPKPSLPATPDDEALAAPAKAAVAEKTVAAKAKADSAKTAAVKTATTKAMGAKPVVLVPAAKSGLADGTDLTANAPLSTAPIATSSGGGLYGDAPVAAPPATAPLKVASTKSIFSPAPAAPVAAAGTGAYVVQLASFSSKAEAQAEYSRLGAKHGAIITKYAPIIAPATIAGSTRYQLDLGPMTSSDTASSVCSTLIAAGERDCKVGRQ